MTVLRQVWDILRRTWDKTVGAVLTMALVGLIRGYQVAISPLLGPTCRYHPSCSAYALRSVRVHGPLKGSLLSAWRLLRCNPWSPGGIDFVPERGSWRGTHEVRPTTPVERATTAHAAGQEPGGPSRTTDK